jgi:putative ABC transport system ATP-binding protein
MDDLKILLMDEPTAALDPRSAETVMKSADSIIRSYNLTAVLITHNLKDAYTYGERVIHMVDGSIARDIGSDERANLQVSDMYSWFL